MGSQQKFWLLSGKTKKSGASLGGAAQTPHPPKASPDPCLRFTWGGQGGAQTPPGSGTTPDLTVAHSQTQKNLALCRFRNHQEVELARWERSKIPSTLESTQKPQGTYINTFPPRKPKEMWVLPTLTPTSILLDLVSNSGET